MSIPTIFERNHPKLAILARKTIGIAGCGGLGSNAAIALARAGIGTLVLADFDTVEWSNLNRQQYTADDIGILKTEALKKHIMTITPHTTVRIFSEQVSKENIQQIFGACDILIEAFDTSRSKVQLIEQWMRLFPNRPVISGSGMAGIGHLDELTVRKMGNLYICGDEKRDMEELFSPARVAIVGLMQAEIAMELLVQ